MPQRILIWGIALTAILVVACSSAAHPATPTVPAPVTSLAATTHPSVTAATTVISPVRSSPTPTAAALTADPASSPNGGGPAVFVWRTAGTGQEQLKKPTRLATDAAAYVYVIDSGNSRVVKYDRDGHYLIAWGSRGAGDGQFEFSRGQAFSGGIAVTGDGTVLVLDDTSRLQRFDGMGTFVGTRVYGVGAKSGQIDQPSGMALDRAGTLYVVDYNNNRIDTFTAGGDFVRSWGQDGADDAKLTDPNGIAVGADGAIYVTDGGIGGQRIQKYTADGAYLEQWGSTGSGPGKFKQVQGIAVDSKGTVYVGDNSGDLPIQAFDRDGRFLGAWGSAGAGAGQFAYVADVAVDTMGNIYATGLNAVDHPADSCVQKFSPR